jgi:hypothetical protein
MVLDVRCFESINMPMLVFWVAMPRVFECIRFHGLVLRFIQYFFLAPTQYINHSQNFKQCAYHVTTVTLFNKPKLNNKLNTFR